MTISSANSPPLLCISLPPSTLACSFLASLSAGCLLFAPTRDSRSIGYQQSTPTRGNVQPVVRTWSSPIASPCHSSSSSSPSYLDCEVSKCKQRDCRVPELTQTHHDANRMGGEEGEGKEKLSSNGHKVAVCQASLWDSPYRTLAACVDPDGARRSCSSGAAVEAVRASGLLVIL